MHPWRAKQSWEVCLASLIPFCVHLWSCCACICVDICFSAHPLHIYVVLLCRVWRDFQRQLKVKLAESSEIKDHRESNVQPILCMWDRAIHPHMFLEQWLSEVIGRLTRVVQLVHLRQLQPNPELLAQPNFVHSIGGDKGKDTSLQDKFGAFFCLDSTVRAVSRRFCSSTLSAFIWDYSYHWSSSS